MAQSLDHPRVLGVALYNELGFLPDQKAVAVEYTRTNVLSGVVRFWTIKGSVITVQKNASVFFVPYPGKDPEVDLQGALLLIEIGERRFPQYSSLWKNLKIAWKNYDSKNPATKEREIAEVRKRENFFQQGLDWLLRKQFSSAQEQDSSPANPGISAGTAAAKPMAGETPATADNDLSNTSNREDQMPKAKETKAIREYYELVNELNKE